MVVDGFYTASTMRVACTIISSDLTFSVPFKSLFSLRFNKDVDVDRSAVAVNAV